MLSCHIYNIILRKQGNYFSRFACSIFIFSYKALHGILYLQVMLYFLFFFNFSRFCVCFAFFLGGGMNEASFNRSRVAAESNKVVPHSLFFIAVLTCSMLRIFIH
jgi:hypothetical protein